MKIKQCLLILLCVMLLTGCWGWRTEKTPVHLTNLDWQAKYIPQSLQNNI